MAPSPLSVVWPTCLCVHPMTWLLVGGPAHGQEVNCEAAYYLVPLILPGREFGYKCAKYAPHHVPGDRNVVAGLYVGME